jgi:heat shock protein HtpX
VLVYDRIARNRRQTLLLVLLALVLTAPFVAAASLGISVFWLYEMGRGASRAIERAAEGRARFGYCAPPPTNGAEPAVTVPLRVVVPAALVLTLAPGVLLWFLHRSMTPRLLGLVGGRSAGEAEREAGHLLEGLALGAGLPTPKLYVVDSLSPNAFASGRDPAHSVIAVTRGLLKLLDRLELEGVLAHELSHIGNGDVRLNAIVAALTLYLRLPYLLRRRRIETAEQLTGSAHALEPLDPFGRLLRLLLSPVYFYFFLIAPILAALIRGAISQRREFLADADAALLTRSPLGLIRALAKLKGAGACVRAAPAVAHFYLADGGAAIGRLVDSHPPVDERIRSLREVDASVPDSVVEAAVEAGREYARAHANLADPYLAGPLCRDELSLLNAGNISGRACRVGDTGTPLYDKPDRRSEVLARIAPGQLLVAFDDPGAFRQVITADHTFGYIPRSIRLDRVDLLASEVFEA